MHRKSVENLSLTALALVSFVLKKKYEVRGQDQQEYPRPQFLRCFSKICVGTLSFGLSCSGYAKKHQLYREKVLWILNCLSNIDRCCI